MYIQVCKSIDNKEVLQREITALFNIKDCYPRYIISMDPVISGNDINGIRVINITDFLLNY
jgi:predicted AAA+ superfamily ATPase